MRKRPRYHDKATKLLAISRVKGGESVKAVAADLGVVRRVLYQWCDAYEREGPEAFRPPGRPRKDGRGDGVGGPALGLAEVAAAAAEEIARLEAKIGRQQMELDFFRKALRQVGEAQPASAGLGSAGSTRSSKR